MQDFDLYELSSPLKGRKAKALQVAEAGLPSGQLGGHLGPSNVMPLTSVIPPPWRWGPGPC